RALSGTSGELLLAAHDSQRLRGFVRECQLHREARREATRLRLLCREAIRDEAPANVLEPGDRVAVRDEAVRVDAHRRAARVGTVEARQAAVRLQLDPPVLDRHLVELDHAPQQRHGERGLVEAGAGDDARDVEPAGILAMNARDVDAESERARLDLVDLAEQLLEAPFRAALRDLRVPAAPGRRGSLEDAAEELDALVEVERLIRVDAERLEEAARRVQVLLVRHRVADERDALRADV